MSLSNSMVSRVAVLLAGWLALAIVPATATATAPSATPSSAGGKPAKGEEVSAATVEFHQLHDEARQAISRSDFDDAQLSYTEALAQDVPRPEKREVLLELGHMLEEKSIQPIKAATIYEQFLSLFPQDPEAPDLNLRLGRIYRDLGSRTAALNKFYDVLYASIRVSQGSETKGIAMRAQLEIANTHFLAGDYEQAGRAYARLKLIELPDNDRRDVYFRAAYVLFLAKDYAGALVAEQKFLERYPECSLAPQSQYLVVQSLRGLNRQEDALREALKLLRAGAKHGRDHPELWAYWQQKMGNDLANDLYQKGDMVRALMVYQTLAEISDAPEWRWPAVYQIGLCFERLRYSERALEAYQYVLDGKAPKPAEGAKPLDGSVASVSLATLREMAKWRSENVRWGVQVEADLGPLLRKDPAAARVALNARPVSNPADAPVAAPLPAPTPVAPTGL